MEEENEKKLKRILSVIVIIIMVIVCICLFNVLFRNDQYGYDLPNKGKTVTTTVDATYQKLTATQLEKYNNMLNDREFLLPLNNAIKGYNDLYNINILQNDARKFIYIYTKMKIDSREDINIDTINEESNNIFKYQIDAKNISNYYINDSYLYNVNENLYFCLKATSSKTEKNKLYLKFDYLSYNEELCNIANNDYTKEKEGLIVYSIIDDKYYIDSFTLLKKEG